MTTSRKIPVAMGGAAAEAAPAAKPPYTRADFAAEYPQLYADFEKDGDEAFSLGKKEGAEHERARIQAVKAVSLPGHEGLIERLMFDGTTTGPEAAALVIAAENAKRKQHLQAIADDAPRPVAHAVAPDLEAGATADAALPLEERCKRAWDRDPKLRAEFGDRYESYLAFSKAEERGSVKILRRA